MSRTKKDKPVNFRDDVQMYSGAYSGHYSWLYEDNWFKENVHAKYVTVPKLRKEKDFEYHWMSTPSEWTRLTMNRPMRRKLKTKLSILKNVEPSQELLEEFDEEEGYKKKPHNYYY